VEAASKKAQANPGGQPQSWQPPGPAGVSFFPHKERTIYQRRNRMLDHPAIDPELPNPPPLATVPWDNNGEHIRQWCAEVDHLVALSVEALEQKDYALWQDTTARLQIALSNPPQNERSPT